MKTQKNMTLGSLFDGIGGALLAAKHAVITPLWASEIEPFPRSVTEKHFPQVKHLGDITKISPETLDPVDIICAGSPCQDLSIAGKRKGLEGERSGLFKTAVNLFHHLRERTNRPRFFVWENVPGAFSSNKGADFRAVLEEIGQTEIPMPPNGRWANAGVAELPQCEIAWRVLDAQYWGVPQRRRRIFLVADFTAEGRCAGEILFEPESVPRHPAESESQREGAAEGTERSLGATGANVKPSASTSAGFKGGQSAKASLGYAVKKAACLASQSSGVEPTIACYDMTHADEVMRPVKNGIVPTLNARMGTGGNQVPVVQGEYVPDTANTLTARMDGSPCVDRGPQVIAVQGSMIGRQEKNGPQGSGLSDVCFTLNTIDRHAVCVGNGQADNARLQEKAGALNCMHDQQCVMFSKTSFAKYEEADNTTPLRASGGDIGGGSENLCCQSFVRRLTPTECERLQGLPDGYTEGGSDMARYKALGNGMAQPCVDYVLRRLAEVAQRRVVRKEHQP